MTLWVTAALTLAHHTPEEGVKARSNDGVALIGDAAQTMNAANASFPLSRYDVQL